MCGCWPSCANEHAKNKHRKSPSNFLGRRTHHFLYRHYSSLFSVSTRTIWTYGKSLVTSGHGRPPNTFSVLPFFCCCKFCISWSISAAYADTAIIVCMYSAILPFYSHWTRTHSTSAAYSFPVQSERLIATTTTTNVCNRKADNLRMFSSRQIHSYSKWS